jgi:uncharacterized protein YigE (DUF2233 family)
VLAGEDDARASAEPDAAALPTGGAELESEAGGEAFKARLFAFDLGAVELEVVDMQMRRDLGRVVSSDEATLFATNGAFFGAKGEPVGLVVSGGKRVSAFSRAMSGGVLTVDDGKATLVATEQFDASSRHGFAVQCKPRLVVGGAVNIRSDDGKRAERTAMCVRKDGREIVFAIVTNAAGGPSLIATASFLRRAGCSEALNLDGGPSTGVAWREGSLVQNVDPREGIRHAITVRKKAEP